VYSAERGNQALLRLLVFFGTFFEHRAVFSNVMSVMSPPQGVPNVGNTCWMSVALQTLRACVPFQAFVLQGKRVDLEGSDAAERMFLFEALVTALMEVAGGDDDGSNRINMQRLVGSYLRVYPDPVAGSGKMRDATEAFGRLCDLIGEVVPTSFDVVHGYLVQTTTRSCGHISELEEHPSLLEVQAFDQALTGVAVADLLQHRFGAREVMVRCSTCDPDDSLRALGSAARVTEEMRALPDFLAVSLARRSDASSGAQHVQIKRSVQLVCAGENFRLVAEALYLPGHYVIVRQHEDQLFLFNDSVVMRWTPETEETWLAQGCARLALYEKSTAPSLFRDPDNAAQQAQDTTPPFVPPPPPDDPAWKCPFLGCSYQKERMSTSDQKTVNIRNSHLRDCPVRQLKKVASLSLHLSPEEQVAEVKKLMVQPDFLRRENKKWCPNPKCCSFLSVSRSIHKLCGWSENPQSRPEPRASDHIEERRVVPEEPEAASVTTETEMDFAAAERVLQGGFMPAVADVSLLRKSLSNPNNRALRPAIGLLWTKCLSFTLRLMVENADQKDAWTLWFLLAPCTLWRQAEKENNREWDIAVSKRMFRWMRGEFLELWQETIVAMTTFSACGEASNSSPDVEVDADDAELDKMRRRVELLIRNKRFSDAANALLAEKPAKLTAENVAILRDKFPISRAPLLPELDHTLVQRLVIDEKLVEGCLYSFPKGSSGGLSGIVPESLVSALRYSVAYEIPLLMHLTKLVGLLANGDAPVEVASWLVGGRLVPIGAKVRPVVVSDTLARLVSKVVRSTQAHLFPEIFCGLQGGVGEHCAIDRTIHFLRENLAQYSDKLDHAVLTVDFRNGFNEVSRASVERELLTKCPNMLPWFRWSYGGPVQLVLANGEHLQADEGLCQGDPLAAFFFALNLQPVLNHTKSTWGEYGLSLLRAFLDDSAQAGPIPILVEILEYLQTSVVVERGLLVRLDKCVLFVPNGGLPDSVRNSYEIPQSVEVTSAGVVALGVPIGTTEFVQRFLFNVVKGVQTFHDRLRVLDAPQLELVLLRLCGGATKVSHLLRCVPPVESGPMCQAVDELSDQALLHIIGLEHKEDLSQTQWRQAHLPLSMSGFGITPTSLIKEAAYLASFCSVGPTTETLQSPLSAALTHSLSSTTQTFNLLVADADKVSSVAELRTRSQEKDSLQRELSRRVARREFDLLMRDATITKVDWGRIKDQTRSGSSGWMNAVYLGQELVIANSTFHLLLQRHLGFSFLPENAKTLCARSSLSSASQRIVCRAAQDVRLYHATDLCRTGFTHRHNTVANTLKGLLHWAGKQCLSEVQCIPGSQDVPADLYICDGPNGIPVAVDVAVVSPICEEATSTLMLTSKAGAYLSRQETKKNRKYDSHFKSINGSIRFLPFVVSSFGGVSAGPASELVTFTARALSQKLLMPLQSAYALVNNQISASLMQFVSVKLSHALASHEKQHAVD
jgi:hypothetical protein